MRSDHVTANGIRFHYLTEGSGPLVLLLHGFPQFSHAWRRQIPALSKRFRVVAPDLRGYGGTEKPAGLDAYRLDTLAADVAGLIEALGEKSAMVVGHDWGGGLAWAAALLFPERISRLAVLNCPLPAVFLKNLRSNPRQLRRSWYMGLFQLPWLPERIFRGKAGSLIAGSPRPGTFTREDVEAYDRNFQDPTPPLNYYRAALRRYRPLPQRKIAAPTLLIWGDKDPALGRELTEGMEPHFSGPLRVEHLPEASHWVNEEEPEKVNALLLEFLGLPVF